MDLTTREGLESHYTAKMAAYSDDRIRTELSFVSDRKAEGNDAWAKPEVMAAWTTCLKAEAASRGIALPDGL